MAEKKAMEPTENLVESFGETTQIITKGIVAAQERNMQFVQSTFTNAVETLKSHIEASRVLMQELEQQTKKLQEAFQKQVPGWTGSQWMESYMDLLRAPFASYQQALDTAEKATRQGLQTFEKAVEDVEKAAGQLPRAAGKQADKQASS